MSDRLTVNLSLWGWGDEPVKVSETLPVTRDEDGSVFLVKPQEITFGPYPSRVSYSAIVARLFESAGNQVGWAVVWPGDGLDEGKTLTMVYDGRGQVFKPSGA